MKQLQASPGPNATIDNPQVDYFCGFSCYSLQSQPSLIQAATVAMQRYDIIFADQESDYSILHGIAYAVIGDHGRDTLEYHGIQGPRRYSCGTLSKAVGGHGGIITGSTALIEQLKHRCKSLIGSSPVPVPAAAATAAGLGILKQQPEMRQQLWDNVAYAKRAFRGLGFEDIPETPVPIICLSNTDVDLYGIQQALFEQGIVVQYIPGGSYTSVPQQGAIRIAIFSGHTKQQIDRLISVISLLT